MRGRGSVVLLVFALACEASQADAPADPGPDGGGADGGDAAAETGGAGAEDADADGDVPRPAPDVDSTLLDFTLPGPFPVGVQAFDLHDEARDRDVPLLVWYPAKDGGEAPFEYLFGLFTASALEGAEPDLSAAPWPLVLFSHGFKGASAQSATWTEHLASWGHVVVAMDHEGNTIFDPDDAETVAEVALERPRDVAFASAAVHDVLPGLADPARVAVTGHSFGAFTALVVAGAEGDLEGGLAACEAGDPSDIFCKYLPFMPEGSTLALDPPLPGLLAAIYLAPAGYSALGEIGLASIGVPGLLFGGTLDTTAPLDAEIDRIFAAHPAPVLRAVVEGAAHLSFTDLCVVEGFAEALGDLCGAEGTTPLSGLDVMRETAALSVAFLRAHLAADPAALAWLAEPGLEHVEVDSKLAPERKE